MSHSKPKPAASQKPADAPKADEQPQTSAGRAANGQFSSGNSFGHGNPFGRRLAAMRQAFLNTVTEDDIQVVAAMLVQKAREGDVAAAKLVLQYAIGKPGPAPEPDRLDVDEWHLRKEGSIEAANVLETIDLATASQANFLVGVVQPVRHKEQVEPFMKEMCGEAPPGSARQAYFEKLRAEEEAEREGADLDGFYDDDEPAWTTNTPPSHTASYGPKATAS